MIHQLIIFIWCFLEFILKDFERRVDDIGKFVKIGDKSGVKLFFVVSYIEEKE
jgi:hypothetical protein